MEKIALKRLEMVLGCGVLFVGIGACSSGSEENASADAGAGKIDTAAVAVASGTFEIHMKAADEFGTAAHASFSGKVNDGPEPSATVWDTKTKSGSCTLLTPRTPFCDPLCSNAICVDTNTCQREPTARSVGALKVTGVASSSGTKEFTATYIAGVYQIVESLLNPPCAEGEEIKVEAAGDFFPGFTLTGNGIAPLTVTNTKIYLENGKGFDLTWTPPTKAGLSKIKVVFDLSHHGGSKGQLICESEDTGTLQVPSPLLAQLIALGVTGYPSMTVTRYQKTSMTLGAGKVALTIYSDQAFVAELPGLVSCNANEDCPTGQTCQTPQLYCK